jgi:CcmD family protein
MIWRVLSAAWPIVVLVLIVAGTALASAQGKDDFVEINPAAMDERLPAVPFIFAAYGIAWAAVLIYVWGVWRRIARVERELREVGAALARDRRG